MKKRRALVTGASGFVGSHLARRLVQEGWEVHVLLRPHASLEGIAPVLGQVGVHRFGGATGELADIVRAAAPDAVFHLAAVFLAEHKLEEIETLVAANILFPTQLLEAMAANGVRLLVNTGTAWQHFENRAYDPVNLYAATKQAFEALLAYYVNARGFSAATLALFDTYGPGDPRPKLMNALWQAAATGQALSMSGGDQLLDMVYIDDVIDAYIATERALREAGPVQWHFGVSSDAPLRLKELVAAFEATLGVRLDARWGERPYRPRETMQAWVDAEAPPGWCARTAFADGLRRSAPRGFAVGAPAQRQGPPD